MDNPINMPEVTPKANNLFYYRLQNFDEVKKALGDLLLAKEALLKDGNEQTKELFVYVDALSVNLSKYNPANLIDSIDISSVCLLPVSLINGYLSSKDSALCDLLSVQLSLICAATMTLPDRNFKNYDFDELMLLQNGNDKIYDDIIFISTIRELIQIVEPDDRVAAIFTSLDAVNPELTDFNKFYWNNALVFGLIMQLVWKNFANFGILQQEFLLENYFYTAIVCGVSMDKILKLFLSSTVFEFDNAQANAAFFKALEANNEIIPTNTNLSSSERLTTLFSSYISKVYSGDIKTLVQEKFIQDIYRGQIGDNIFSNWLRISLNVYYSLRNKEYLPK